MKAASEYKEYTLCQRDCPCTSLGEHKAPDASACAWENASHTPAPTSDTDIHDATRAHLQASSRNQ